MPTLEQARAWYAGADPVHDYDHILRVYRMAERLASGLPFGGTFIALFLFSALGPFLVDTASARPLSGQPDTPPSLEYPLGTDTAGRNILAAMIVGTPITLRIGLIAASIGLTIGVILGFSAGFFGGTHVGLGDNFQ